MRGFLVGSIFRMGPWPGPSGIAHGLHIQKEGSQEFLYLCDTQRGVVVKATLTGEQVWSIGYPKESPAYAPDADGWRAAQHAIAELAAYCRDHGIGLLIADLPELHEVADYPFKRQTDQLAAVAAANGVPFVDLLPTVADVKDVRTLWVTPTDAHPNGRAAERYAARLEQVLRATFPNRF